MKNIVQQMAQELVKNVQSGIETIDKENPTKILTLMVMYLKQFLSVKSVTLHVTR